MNSDFMSEHMIFTYTYMNIFCMIRTSGLTSTIACKLNVLFFCGLFFFGRSYVGNIHTKVTDSLMVELFSGIGHLEGCKLIRKDKVCLPLHIRPISQSFSPKTPN